MKKGMAKKTTLTMLVFILGCGSIGAFFPSFNMDGYVSLIKGFSPYFMILITSIGANSAVTKVAETKKGKNNESKS